MPSETPPPPGVLFVNRVYPPDGAATGHYLREMAEGLACRGWRVGVLVTRSVPDSAEAETVNGVAVRRVPVLPFTRGSIVRRLACYASAYLALLWRLARMPLPDVVVVKTDPPLLVTMGAVIARLRGRRLVHWSQDLYPEVAEALGALGRFRLAGGLLRHLSTRALGACGRVVAIGRCMAGRLRARGIAADRIAVVPNWAEPDLIRPAPDAGRRFRHEQGWDDRFVVMYSGNLGLAHPFDGLLDAAAAAGSATPDLLFAIIGDGARMAEVRAKVADRRLDNVRFLPMQPRGMLPETLAAADAHVVLMEPSLSGLLVPSKVYNVLASGRPCLFMGPAGSEIAALLAETGAGASVAPDDGAAAHARLIGWRDDPAGRAAVGARARAAAEVRTPAAAVEAFDRLLRDVLAEPARPRRR